MTLLSRYTTSNLVNLLDEIYRFDGYSPLSHYSRAKVVPVKDDLCQLEVELPGFSRDQIQVYTERNLLYVKAEKNKEVSTRTFYRSWSLSQDERIGRVRYDNGMLTVEILKVVPDEHKRRDYSIE